MEENMKQTWMTVYNGNMSETIKISDRVYLRKGNLPEQFPEEKPSWKFRSVIRTYRQCMDSDQ